MKMICNMGSKGEQDFPINYKYFADLARSSAKHVTNNCLCKHA